MGDQNNGNSGKKNGFLDKGKFPDLECIIDDVYKLVQGAGVGGFAKIYLSDVDLEKFDYATVAAFREKKTGQATDNSIPLSRDAQFEQVEKRAEQRETRC